MDPVTAVLAFIIFVLLMFFITGQKKKDHPKYPPGPPRLPIIGHMHLINMKKPYHTFYELATQYGPVYSLQVGAQKIVVLCGYETVRDALVNQAEDFVDRPHVPIFTDISNNQGVTFSNGNNWKVIRRFTISTLRDFGMGKKTIEDKITEECQNLVNTFKSYRGNPFENTMDLNLSVANITVSILLGDRLEYSDPKLRNIFRVIHNNARIVGSPMVQLYNAFPSLIKWLPGSHRHVKATNDEMRAFIKDTFTKKRKQLDVNDQRSFIDVFLVKQKEEKPNPEIYFSDANLISLVSDLFSAGMEALSTTLQWGLLLMMKYPEVQKKVQNEIDRVVGSGEPRAMHQKQLPYTEAVIHEIQRFGNIVPTNVPHATTRDVVFKGFFIPKGTHIMPLLHSVLRDRKYFEKPDEFYPKHFLDSKGNFLENEAFIPFSAGKRNCAGISLAKMELFLFFTTLLQNFTFEAPPGAKLDLAPAVGFTHSPLKHEIRAIPRN